MTDWACRDCPSTGDGDGNWARADREAAEHTQQTEHTTVTTTVGSSRERGPGGVRDRTGGAT